MYRNCIFCSSNLGRNEALEAFPVGRALAFDGWRGRLWCICPRCRRWNLAPLEERWDAVEEAERRFRDARRRVHSENIGLAELPDGTRLVRVGEALPGELAAWRYGRELRRRRWRYWLASGVGAAVSLASGIPAWPGAYRRREVVYRLPASDAPDGRGVLVRRRDLNGAEFRSDAMGDGPLLRAWIPPERGMIRRRRELELRGADARTLLERALVALNQRGASRGELERALRELDAMVSAESFVGRLGIEAGVVEAAPHPTPPVLRIRESWKFGNLRGKWVAEAGRAPVDTARMLALEMALHDAAERRALEGDLAELEARWREAEEIAQIADSL